MQTEKVDTIIIGGGLSGLYAAFLMAARNHSPVLLEARSRLGGRILSPVHQGFFADLGPSWYWPMINPRVTALIKTLGLTGYPQFETGLSRFQDRSGHVETIAGYPMEPPGWRLVGGMISLVNGLLARIPENVIRLNHPVCEIEQKDSGIQVTIGHLDEEPAGLIEASGLFWPCRPGLRPVHLLHRTCHTT
ncbi:MAG: FAD-dependent oxidoreductase [Desulfobacterales bacterium]